MVLKVKKNKKPKTPKVTFKESKSKSGKQSQAQSITVNIHKQKRNVANVASLQKPKPSSSPNISIYTPPQIPNDFFTQLINKIKVPSPFEASLALSSIDDKVLDAERLRRQESKKVKAQVAPITASERLGLDSETIPFQVGAKAPLSQQGTLGFSQVKRLTEAELLEQKRPPQQVTQEFLREQRLYHLKKPYNSLERVIAKAQDYHAEPTTIDDALAGIKEPSTKEALETFSEDHNPIGESHDPRDDIPLPSGEIPSRVDSYLREHGTSGDIERFAREDVGGDVSLHEQGEDLADAEYFDSLSQSPTPADFQKADETELEAIKASSQSLRQGALLDRAELGQGEGIFGQLAREERQGLGFLETPLEAEERRRRGRPMKPRPESTEPTTGKGRKIQKDTPQAIAQREATRAHRARAKEAATAAQTEAYRGIQGFFTRN